MNNVADLAESDHEPNVLAAAEFTAMTPPKGHEFYKLRGTEGQRLLAITRSGNGRPTAGV